MTKIRTENRGNVAVLTLNNGTTNAISPDLVIQFSEIKSNRVEEIKSRYEKNYKSKHEFLLDCWFSEPAQKLLKDASKKF